MSSSMAYPVGAGVDTGLNETNSLIASDRVEGTAVYNQQGERLGTIKNFMVNKRNGHAAYAVMSFGGFLGMGESYHPLPWEVLNYDNTLGGYVVNLTRDQMEGGPAYVDEERPDWGDPTYGRHVHDYYGVPYGIT